MKNAGVLVGVLLLILGSTIFYQSLAFDYYSDYGPGPGLFPLWLSGGLIVLSIAYIYDSVKKNPIDLREIMPKGKARKDVLSILLSTVVFLLLIPVVGYTIAGVAMLCMLFMREYKWYMGLGLSVAITLIVFFLFSSLLNVPLPVNSFGF